MIDGRGWIIVSSFALVLGCGSNIDEVAPASSSDAGTTFDTFPPIGTVTSASTGIGTTSTTSTQSSSTTSSSGASSTGTSTGDDSGLEGEGVLVRYWFDEPEGSQNPELLDATDDPLPLPLDYADGAMSWTEIEPGRRGLTWAQPGLDGTAAIPVAGTKLELLEGAQQATIEVVCDVTGVNAQDSRIVHFGAGVDTGDFTLASGSPTAVEFQLEGFDDANDPTAQWTYPIVGNRTVFHLVLDIPNPSEADRIRLYADGTRVSDPLVYTLIPPETVIDIVDGALFSLGNRGNGARSLGGTMHYAALYLSALSEDAVAHNAAFLDVDDPR